jgi:hypothetical protein
VDLDPGQLFASMVVSTIGFGLFLYGKKQTRVPQLVAGIVLMLGPMFIGSGGLVWALGGLALGGVWAATHAGM